jgi:ABC-type transporter Mla subunit MlaD
MDIQGAISPEAIAAHLTEALRQQLAHTGLPEWTNQIALHTAALSSASKQLSSAILQFTDPNTGATHRLNTALSSMQSNLNNAADHVRSLLHTLQKELFTSLVVLSLGAAIIGFFLGTLYAKCSH